MPDHLLSHGRGTNMNKSGHTSNAIMAQPDKSAMTSVQSSSKPISMPDKGTTTTRNPAGAGKPGGPSQTV